MRTFVNKARSAASLLHPSARGHTACDALQDVTPGLLAAVAGGLNPQPLPPYHEPEHLEA